MKKYLFIFLLLVCLLVLPSCSKVKSTELNNLKYGKLKYYHCGIYVEIDPDQNHTLSDENPKIYFDFSDINDASFGNFAYNGGSGLGFVQFTNIARYIQEYEDEGYTLYYGAIKLLSSRTDLEKAILRPIIFKDGNYEVAMQRYEEISFEGNYNYVCSFTVDSANYKVQLALSFVSNKGE